MFSNFILSSRDALNSQMRQEALLGIAFINKKCYGSIINSARNISYKKSL